MLMTTMTWLTLDVDAVSNAIAAHLSPTRPVSFYGIGTRALIMVSVIIEFIPEESETEQNRTEKRREETKYASFLVCVTLVID